MAPEYMGSNAFSAGEEVKIFVYLTSLAMVAAAEVSVSFYNGDMLVASDSSDPTPIPSSVAAGYIEFDFSIAPEVAQLDAAAGNLRLDVAVTGAGIYMGAAGGHHTRVELPIASPVPVSDVTTASEDLTAEEPEIDLSFANETNATTGPAFTITEAAPGNWTIVVSTQDFTGNLLLRFAEPMPEETDEVQEADQPDGDTSLTTSTQTSTTSRNATGNETLDGGAGEQAPGVGAVALVAGLVRLALVRRQR